MTFGLRMGMVTIGLIVFFLAIGTLQRPPVESIQRGYRGLGMIELYHPASLLAEENANRIPEPSPKQDPTGQLASQVYSNVQVLKDVDAGMLERTEQFLLNRVGGDVKRPAKEMGRAADAITRAYVAWAMTEGGAKDELSQELALLGEQSKTRKDPYFLALVGLSQLQQKKLAPDGVALMKRLRDYQLKDGRENGVVAS